METKVCSMCGKETSEYGVLDDMLYCFDCCGKVDTQYMKDHDKIDLYLTGGGDTWYISNWPGTLKIEIKPPKKGKHNIARTRYDVWFNFAGKSWHGVQYGEWTQICHCKVIKSA